MPVPFGPRLNRPLRSLFVAAVLAAAGAAFAGTVTYTTSGTWTAPLGVTSATVEAWGGGGAGGGATGNPAKGGGGAGGQYAKKVVAVTGGSNYAVVVGAGGVGSTAAGPAGGDSTFATTSVVAKGGAGGGLAATNNSGGTAGVGSVTGGVGDLVYRGGNGSAGIKSSTGGAGGGGAGSTGAGGDASGNTAGTGTATGGGSGATGLPGGTGADCTNTAAVAGGGGCGGNATNNTDRSGGSGAAGQVIITYVDPPPLVLSINRASFNPATSGDSVSWTVTFSQSVTGVDVGDFALVQSGGVSGATLTSATGSGTSWTVTANTGAGNGSLGLNLVDNDSIINAASLPLGGAGLVNGNFTGQVYTVAAPVPVLAKVASTSAAVVNDVLTFSITATNPYGISMSSISVTDILPTGMTYLTNAVTAGSVAIAGQTVTWTIPTLGAGANAQLTLAIKVTVQGSLTNTVTSPGATPASATVLVLANAVTQYKMDGTVGSWNGTTNEVIDSGGTALHGTRVTTTSPTTTNLINPAPTIASQYPSVVGGFCNAASFDGNAVVQVPHSAAFDYTQKLSASAWIYPTAYPGSDYYSIFSNDQNYEFHLDPAGKLYWWWNSSSLTSAATIPLNQWTHIAITMDSSAGVARERMYINGVLDTVIGNWSGTLASNPCPFYIGGDVTTGSCALIPTRNFRGRIDEIKLYNYELAAAEVQADMTLGRNCSGNFDHIQIEHDGTGSVCTPETVTVKACMNAACNTLYPGSVTVQMSPTGWVGGDTVVINNGVGTASLSKATAGTVTLGTVSTTPTATSATRCFNGATETCAMTFASASCLLDAVETGAAAKTRLFTKLAGTAFNVDVLALSSGTTINTGYTGDVTVDLVDTSVSSCPTGAALSGTSQSVTFVSGNAGRKPVTFTYAQAIPNVRVRMTPGASAAACSTDNFAIRPSAVTLTTSPAMATGPSATATPVIKAGTAFALNASTAFPATIGYTASLALDSSLLTAQTTAQDTTTQSGGTLGTFTPTSLAVNASPALSGNANYDEVGYLYLAAGAFRDDTFTSVDQPTGCAATNTCDCVTNTAGGANLADTLASGKYGCSIGNKTAVSLGRFIPDHFDTSATGPIVCSTTAGTVSVTSGSAAVTGTGTSFLSAISPGNTVQINGAEYLVSAVPSATSLTLATPFAAATASGLSISSCPAGGMVYARQAFSAQVTAKNLAGATTTNYTGKFAKAVTLSAAAAKGGAAIAATAPGGTMTANVAAATSFTNGTNSAALAAPGFTFATTPTLPTSVFVRATDTDSVVSLRSPASASVEGGVKVVSGRIKIPNAYGSERLPLPMTTTVQYYNAGANWVTSSTDSVSAFNSNLSSAGGDVVANIVTGLGSGVAVVSPGTAPVVAGVRTFTLAAPMVSGNVDISLNAPIYLPSTTGRATFGIFRSPLIYRRENY